MRLWSVFCNWLRSARLFVMALLDAYADMAETSKSLGAAGGVVDGLDVINASALDMAASPLSPRSVQQARDARDRLFGAEAEDTRPLPPVPPPVSPCWYPPPAAPRWGHYYPVGGSDGVAAVDAVLVVESRLGAVDGVLWLRLIYATALNGAALN